MEHCHHGSMAQRLHSQTREEQAKLEIGHTAIASGVKWALLSVGLATLLAVPAVQTYRELRQHADGRRTSPWPQCFEILEALPRAARAYHEHSGNWVAKTFQANAMLVQEIEKYETKVKAESFLTESILPWAQEHLVSAGGGNEQCYVGRQGWLFYRPGIDHCTGSGFLSRRHLARRADSARTRQPPPQPDPRAAILQFHRQLAERGIRLAIMPTPDKATIHPEKFSVHYEGLRTSVHNPSYQQFLDEMKAEGVLVCDVTALLADYCRRSRVAAYLATDTHWRPEAMELAATHLARFLEKNIVLNAPAATATWYRTSATVTNLGDIAMMLRLPRSQRTFSPETVTIRPVANAAGEPWQPDRSAEVLLLGDSFANIYSLDMMNWGKAAGLAEQLSFALNRPADAIVRNDDGAYATRAILSNELAQGEDRLAGKKVVVWQFAARELSVGDWRLLDLTRRPSRAPGDDRPSPAREVILSGTLVAKSAAPRAGQIPYAHHIFTIDLTDLQCHSGTLTEPKIAVYLFSMKDYRNTPAFAWPIGKRVKLKLQPWSPGFFLRYGRINRSETNDIKITFRWWGETLE